MIFDLRTQIESDIYLIVGEFLQHDWKNVNDDIIEKTGSGSFPQLKGLPLIISPKILHYPIGHKLGIVSNIWYGCYFEVNEKLIDVALTYFVELFEKIKYKPFTDEDAKAKYFIPYKAENNVFPTSLLRGKKYIKTGFFLNPDYPNGYWHNHTIDTIRLHI